MSQRHLMAALGVVLALGLGCAARTQTQSQALPTSELVIDTAGGPRKFTVEVARNASERATGLMFRTELAPDRGMLFDYDHAQPVIMWMKNTFIPLDMLFIGADSRVVNIAEWTTPRSLDEVPSKGPVKAVLELNGGTAARLGIRPGDRVQHSVFQPGG